MKTIEVNKIDVGYANELIIKNLSISIPSNKITTIIYQTDAASQL